MNDKIETIDRATPTPFNGWNKINRATKTFSTNPKIKRNGENLNLQDFLNENNKDCTIYDVYNTYRGDKKLTAKAMNVLTHKVEDTLMEIKDLPSAMEVLNKTKETWKDLPIEIRKEFNNDISHFQRNGLNWAKAKIETVKTEQTKLQQKYNEAKKIAEQYKNETVTEE